MDEIERLSAKAEISDAMLRYARAVDRRDWEAVRCCFFEDSTDHHGDFKGTRDQFIDWVRERHVHIDRSAHFLGNCLIEFASDYSAVVETYFITKMLLGDQAKGHRDMLLGGSKSDRSTIEMYGRYLDRFEKRKGEWRVARRTIVYDFEANESPIVGPRLEVHENWALGRRDRDDPVYHARSAAGLK